MTSESEIEKSNFITAMKFLLPLFNQTVGIFVHNQPLWDKNYILIGWYNKLRNFDDLGKHVQLNENEFINLSKIQIKYDSVHKYIFEIIKLQYRRPYILETLDSFGYSTNLMIDKGESKNYYTFLTIPKSTESEKKDVIRIIESGSPPQDEINTMTDEEFAVNQLNILARNIQNGSCILKYNILICNSIEPIELPVVVINKPIELRCVSVYNELELIIKKDEDETESTDEKNIGTVFMYKANLK